VFLNAVRRLYEYHFEMTERVLAVADALNAGEFTSVVVKGQPPVRDTLVHMIDTETCHFRWLDGSMTRDGSFARVFPLVDFPDTAAVRSFWSQVAGETRAFIATLSSDADMERVYRRTLSEGGARERFLWEVMLHVEA